MDNIDVNYGQHLNTRHKILSKYSTALKQLRSFAEKTYELRPFVFDNFVLFQYFQNRNDNITERSSVGTNESGGYFSFSPMTFLKMELLNHILDRRRQILYWLFYLLLGALCVFVYRHETSASVAERSVRSMVYPGMRMWRRMTLPLIERFPRLTELYDESCLMGNPFFQVDDESCLHCSHVDSVLDLTTDIEIDESRKGNNQRLPSENVPFVFKVSVGYYNYKYKDTL